MAEGIKSETQVKAEPSEASPPEAHVHGRDKSAVLKPDDEDARQFTAEYAKSNRSTCQYSKCPRDGYIEKGEVRLGKLVSNPFVDDPDALMVRFRSALALRQYCWTLRTGVFSRLHRQGGIMCLVCLKALIEARKAERRFKAKVTSRASKC